LLLEIDFGRMAALFEVGDVVKVSGLAMAHEKAV
jgi:hypothetical protein